MELMDINNCCENEEVSMLKFRKKRENGSATIEAVVCLTLFLFFMLFFIMIVQLTMTQTIMQNALNQTAKELSQDLYLYDAFGLVDFRQSISGENNKAVEELKEVSGAVSDAKAELMGDGDIVDNVQSAFQSITLLFSDSDDPDAIKDDFLEKFSPENLKSGGKTVINSALNSLVSSGENAMIPVLFKKYVSSDGKSGTADRYLKRLHVVNGTKGLDFGKSSMFGVWSFKNADDDGETSVETEVEADMNKEANGESGTTQGDKNTINLILEYKVEILHPIEGWKKVNCIQSSATRVWTGDYDTIRPKTDEKEGEDVKNEEETIFAYCVPTGERYHPDRHCRTLARSREVNKISIKDAKARGLTICGVCGSKD